MPRRMKRGSEEKRSRLYLAISNLSLRPCASMSTGEIYLCGPWAEGVVDDGAALGPRAVPVKSLRGRKVKALFAGYNKAMVLVDGYNISWLGGPEASESEDVNAALQDVRVQAVAFGEVHCAALTLDGNIRTWGAGENGELGQGGAVLESPLPQPVVIRSKVAPVFTHIASGRRHMAAVSDAGDLYTWGRGVEGQTGLSSKSADAEVNQNLIGVQLVPKYVGSLQGMRITRVACGENFTTVVNEGGEVWSFGEALSGQLGTGRETKRLLPARVIECAENNAPFVDVACGLQHTVALTESGDLYSWGFNNFGQLGLGDTKTRFAPARVPAPAGGFRVAKIAAASNYSSALTVYQELFAWGCYYGGRLAHAEPEHKTAPTLVTSMVGKEPRLVACAAANVAAFSPTCVLQLAPNCGPIEGGTTLVVEGAGFWPSDDITVRFIPVENEDGSAAEGVAPRATLGTCLDDGRIQCRTPKMGVACKVKVEVALDGKSFTGNGKIFSYYEVPELGKAGPAFVHASGGTELTIAAISTNLWESPLLAVKFDEVVPALDAADEAAEAMVLVEGGRSATVAATVLTVSLNSGSEEDPAEDEYSGSDEGSAAAPNIEQFVKCVSPEWAGEFPLNVRISVAFNGQDFFVIGEPAMIFHNMRLLGAAPKCCPVLGGTVISLQGQSFFKSDGLQAHLVFESIVVDEETGEEEVSSQVLPLNVVVHSATNLLLKAPGLFPEGAVPEELLILPEDEALATEEPSAVDDEGVEAEAEGEGEGEDGTEAAAGVEAEVAAAEVVAAEEADTEALAEVEAAAVEGKEAETGPGLELDLPALFALDEPINSGQRCTASLKVTFDGGATYVGLDGADDAVPFDFYRPGPISLVPSCGPISGGTRLVISGLAPPAAPSLAQLSVAESAAAEGEAEVAVEEPDAEEGEEEAAVSAPSSEADVLAPAQTNWFIRSDAATVRILAADRDLDLVQPAELVDAPLVSAAQSLDAEAEEGENGEAAPEATGEPDVDLVIMTPELARQEVPMVEAAAAAAPVDEGDGEEDAEEVDEEAAAVAAAEKAAEDWAAAKAKAEAGPVLVAASISVALNGIDYALRTASFTYYPDPIVSDVAPSQVQSGMMVRLTGEEFFDAGSAMCVCLKGSSEREFVVPVRFVDLRKPPPVDGEEEEEEEEEELEEGEVRKPKPVYAVEFTMPDLQPAEEPLGEEVMAGQEREGEQEGEEIDEEAGGDEEEEEKEPEVKKEVFSCELSLNGQQFTSSGRQVTYFFDGVPPPEEVEPVKGKAKGKTKKK